jgi:hypothetical protein
MYDLSLSENDPDYPDFDFSNLPYDNVVPGPERKDSALSTSSVCGENKEDVRRHKRKEQNRTACVAQPSE